MESLKASWGIFCDRALQCKSVAAVRMQAEGGGGGAEGEGGATSMKKVLGAGDLTMLGIGGIIGAGVFVTTGVAARGRELPDGSFDGAGPAVTASFAIASIVAFLCALCYTEFATAVPVAGGAYVYVTLTFGELAAWLVGTNLLLEYTLSSAAVARGWTSYLAETMQMEPSALRVNLGGMELDFPAAVVIMALTALLSRGIREGASFNAVITAVNLAVIAVILCVGFAKSEAENYVPFAPNGWPAVSAAASVVFFSFIGFDTVASTAEEVRNPSRDLPIGILASLGVCTLLYIAMSLALAGLEPWDTLDIDAPFGKAFRERGMPWVDTLVSIGALTGITTSLLVALVGGARVLVTLARDRLVPFHGSLSRLHELHRTPHVSQWVTGVCSAAVALGVDIEILARMVNIGTLFVFFSVSAAVLARRYSGSAPTVPPMPVMLRLLFLTTSCVFFSIAAKMQAPAWAMALLLAYILLSAMTFLQLKELTKPQQFRAPLVPYVPAAAMAGAAWLIGSLGGLAFLRFAIWCGISVLTYVGYGMFRTSEAAKEAGADCQTPRNGPRVGPDELPASSSPSHFWEGEDSELGDGGGSVSSGLGPGDVQLSVMEGNHHKGALPPSASAPSLRSAVGRGSDRLLKLVGSGRPNDPECEILNQAPDSATD